MIADGAREKLLKAFDRAQTAYETWQKALGEKKDADSAESSAHTAYLNAKLDWERALKSCSPGDIELPREPKEER